MDDEPHGLRQGWKLIHRVEVATLGARYEIPFDQIKLVAKHRAGNKDDYRDMSWATSRSYPSSTAFLCFVSLVCSGAVWCVTVAAVRARQLNSLERGRHYVVWFSQIMLQTEVTKARKRFLVEKKKNKA